MIAARLQKGDDVRVVSPAVSLGFIPEDQQLTARERLEGLGLPLSFSTKAEGMDRFDSSPVEARVTDLHERLPTLKSKAYSPPSAATTATSCSGIWTTI